VTNTGLLPICESGCGIEPGPSLVFLFVSLFSLFMLWLCAATLGLQSRLAAEHAFTIVTDALSYILLLMIVTLILGLPSNFVEAQTQINDGSGRE
jgi:hypothetical protein